MGAKGKPFYRLVVKEKRSKRDGKYLENVGTYNPMLDPAEVLLNHDRIQYWIGVGAQPTETVKSLIKNNPIQTDEERAAAQQAKVDKKAAAEAERLAVKKAEAEKFVAEIAEKEATEKAAADKAAADAAAAAAEAAAAAVEEAPAEEALAEQATNAAPAEVDAAVAAEPEAATEEAPAEEAAVIETEEPEAKA